MINQWEERASGGAQGQPTHSVLWSRRVEALMRMRKWQIIDIYVSRRLERGLRQIYGPIPEDRTKADLVSEILRMEFKQGEYAE